MPSPPGRLFIITGDSDDMPGDIEGILDLVRSLGILRDATVDDFTDDEIHTLREAGSCFSFLMGEVKMPICMAEEIMAFLPRHSAAVIQEKWEKEVKFLPRMPMTEADKKMKRDRAEREKKSNIENLKAVEHGLGKKSDSKYRAPTAVPEGEDEGEELEDADSELKFYEAVEEQNNV